jgi:hypothetical protein
MCIATKYRKRKVKKRPIGITRNTAPDSPNLKNLIIQIDNEICLLKQNLKQESTDLDNENIDFSDDDMHVLNRSNTINEIKEKQTSILKRTYSIPIKIKRPLPKISEEPPINSSNKSVSFGRAEMIAMKLKQKELKNRTVKI